MSMKTFGKSFAVTRFVCFLPEKLEFDRVRFLPLPRGSESNESVGVQFSPGRDSYQIQDNFYCFGVRRDYTVVDATHEQMLAEQKRIDQGVIGEDPEVLRARWSAQAQEVAADYFSPKTDFVEVVVKKVPVESLSSEVLASAMKNNEAAFVGIIASASGGDVKRVFDVIADMRGVAHLTKPWEVFGLEESGSGKGRKTGKGSYGATLAKFLLETEGFVFDDLAKMKLRKSRGWEVLQLAGECKEDVERFVRWGAMLEKIAMVYDVAAWTLQASSYALTGVKIAGISHNSDVFYSQIFDGVLEIFNVLDREFCCIVDSGIFDETEPGPEEKVFVKNLVEKYGSDPSLEVSPGFMKALEKQGMSVERYVTVLNLLDDDGDNVE